MSTALALGMLSVAVILASLSGAIVGARSSARAARELYRLGGEERWLGDEPHG